MSYSRLLILTITLPFLFIQQTLAGSSQLQQSPANIVGADDDSRISFSASTLSNRSEMIDLAFNGKRIHAEIDYVNKSINIHTFQTSNNATVKLSEQDIISFKSLKHSLPIKLDRDNPHTDALVSLLNLLASAPLGASLDIKDLSGVYTPICSGINSNGTAVFSVGGATRRVNVTVGPACFVAPALGRCGAGGGPDPGIGNIQRFTQQCLNHDQCCTATHSRHVFGKIDVCGRDGTAECIPEFIAAAPGFFFAPDCSAATGKWQDVYGFNYTLNGGTSGNSNTAFSGSVDTISCGVWSVSGDRDSQGIELVAVNPSGPNGSCAGSFTYSGSLTDCSSGQGSWVNDAGSNGTWEWSRESFSAAAAILNAKRGPTPASR